LKRDIKEMQYKYVDWIQFSSVGVQQRSLFDHSNERKEISTDLVPSSQ
jgi:hypothetical protein